MTPKPKPLVKVLFVDDDPSFRAFFEEPFSDLGWQGFFAEDFQTAINLIERHFFHAAVIDIELTSDGSDKEEGMLLLERLKRTGEPTGAMIITGHPTGDRYRRAYGDFRVIDFFEKSRLEQNEVINKIQEAYKGAEKIFEEEKSKLTFTSYQQGLDLQKFERELVGTSGNKVVQILKRLVIPIYPFRFPVNYEEIDRSGPDPVFVTSYWSRLLGQAIRIRIGKVNQIFKEYEDLKRQGVDVPSPETIGDLSGIRFPAEDLSPSDFV